MRLMILVSLSLGQQGYGWLSQQNRQTRHRSGASSSQLQAKRNKRVQSKQDVDDLNRWYDSVDSSARPDDVFWEEMERQRLLSRVGDGGSGGSGSSSSDADTDLFATSTPQSPSSQVPSPLSRANSAVRTASLNGVSPQSAEATLSQYEPYAVDDNWLDEELTWMMQGDLYEEDDEYSDDLNDDEDDDDDDDDNAWMQSDEPWDHWGEDREKKEERDRVRIDPNNRASSYLLFDPTTGKDKDDDEDENDEFQKEVAAHAERLSKMTIHSRRLDKARNSPKAAAFFNRQPDELEGFDRLWVSAIDNVCFKNLIGTFRNYGIEFADNFGDWQDGSMEDGFYSIEDVASFKARQVYEVTGLPCIASRTSFEVEPVPNLHTGQAPSPQQQRTPGGSANFVSSVNPRVSSGYLFNDVGMHVDYICEALRPLSEPHRVTRFTTCLCYYDGEVEVFDYGVCDVDLVFAESIRTFIPVAQAINEMMKTLELTFGLEYQPWIKTRMDEAARGIGGASLKLRDRVLKEGRVLPNEIIDVSAFMDSMVDVDLMDDCAKELATHFVDLKPTKILTVATTGLVIALPMAKYLQVPVVYARKERNIVMADTFQARYSSKTVGKNRELLVSTNHIDEHDRILVVDDFLSSGASQEALLRIVSEAGAEAVGVGVLLEKVYDSGRQSLSGFNVPIHSLCRVASLRNGVIQLIEEEGFDRMMKSTPKNTPPVEPE